MDTLKKVKAAFVLACASSRVSRKAAITVQPMAPQQAIGKSTQDFALAKGKEVLVEATFQGARGQAFTNAPAEWKGSLDDLLTLELNHSSKRAIFVAAMNAVLRLIGKAKGTIHCRDDEPTVCGETLARRLSRQYGKKRVGVIGFQPAIVRAMAIHFGCGNVLALDLNPENIGSIKFGVRIRDGNSDLDDLVAQCDLGLATGSSLVNGTIDQILQRFEQARKPLIFYGNTISGAAALLGLNRVCPYGQ